jgi:hypothetical protein
MNLYSWHGIGHKLKIAGYDEAWIGWVTESSYLINKIRSRVDSDGNISVGHLLNSIECEWIKKTEFHLKYKSSK